ncbi:ABC transporter permease, partial [Rhodococcus sp. NPDC058514]
MIWACWRQCRTTVVVALSIIGVLIGAVIVAGFANRRSAISDEYGILTLTTLLAVLLPMLWGAFVGVTVFSRDLEQRTHVLGLSQSSGRTRWYVSRVLEVLVRISFEIKVLVIAICVDSSPRVCGVS